jgi:hypothetical protein
MTPYVDAACWIIPGPVDDPGMAGLKPNACDDTDDAQGVPYTYYQWGVY